jgi:alpha-beta hydrolase superfamily lysophospholipase
MIDGHGDPNTPSRLSKPKRFEALYGMTDPEILRIRSEGVDLYERLRSCEDARVAVLLLCGLGFHTFEYGPLACRLADNGISCLSFDYRGHGRSGGPRCRWILEELATDTRHALDVAQRAHDGRVLLFGNSLGTMVADFAAVRDERPAALIAANTPANTADFLLTPPRRVLYRLLKLAEPVVAPRIVNHFITYEQLIDDPGRLQTNQRDRLIGDARQLSVSTYRELLEGWYGPRTRWLATTTRPAP